jgi:crotonobetainyl-CoA:carnitine CoA-transferase CaiB-like acyl-CoA transferase
MSDQASDTLPLAGVRVLEFCHTIMGPSAGVLLADLGADVVKIEAAPDGDTTRRMRGFGTGFFYAFNRNKRSLAVDLKSDQGRELIYKLAENTDVVLENFGPGTMDRLKCGYEDLAAINSRLIYCALKGFLSGPYEHRPALDEVVQYMGGLAYMTGPPGQPLRAGASVIDIMGGMFAVIGVQAALLERASTGRGQFVKSALYESTTFLMTQHMAGEAITGKPAPPMASKGARAGIWSIYEAFETSDGEKIFIGLTSDKHWRAFWEHFERPDIIENPRFATNADRVENRPEFRGDVVDCVKSLSLPEMTKLADSMNIPFAPVAKPGDLFDDPQLNAHGRMLDIEFPNGVTKPVPPMPIEMGEHVFGLRRQAPKVGEHTREILGELGLDEGAIDALQDQGVIVWPQDA